MLHRHSLPFLDGSKRYQLDTRVRDLVILCCIVRQSLLQLGILGSTCRMRPDSWPAKAAACTWVWARIAFWPVFLVHELILLPRR